MVPIRNLQYAALTLEPLKLLKEAQKKTCRLTYLATNLLLLNQETTLFQNLEAGLSDLEKDLAIASEKFHTLFMNERREEGNCLIWKICKIRTLIQEELRTVSDDRAQSNLENFSNRLTGIEIECIHPFIVSTIDPSY